MMVTKLPPASMVTMHRFSRSFPETHAMKKVCMDLDNLLSPHKPFIPVSYGHCFLWTVLRYSQVLVNTMIIFSSSSLLF